MQIASFDHHARIYQYCYCIIIGIKLEIILIILFLFSCETDTLYSYLFGTIFCIFI